MSEAALNTRNRYRSVTEAQVLYQHVIIRILWRRHHRLHRGQLQTDLMCHCDLLN